MPKKNLRRSASDRVSRPEPHEPQRELIVVARPGAGLRARAEGVTSASGAAVRDLSRLLAGAGATMTPLFGPTEERVLRATERSPGKEARRMADYYRVRAPDARLDRLAASLRKLPQVEGAYVKPAAEPAALRLEVPRKAGDAALVTPDFTSRQGYVEASPAGIHARFAWRRSGGLGTGLRIIDVEAAWRFAHEDLLENQGGVVAGTPTNDLAWRNHGTAVLGVLGGDHNGIGVSGICPEASLSAVSLVDLGSGPAIQSAADFLGPGDILLIETHRPGPRFDFEVRADTKGYIAVEWWPDDFAAIQYATGRGVVVVEVAGNGAEDLDDALYDVPAPGFPPSWVNPFRRVEDPGAILVGAGAPPPGTHGHGYGPDRSRLAYSNFGSAIDAQGWGFEITTCGYGDLQGGEAEDLWYTDRFAGTSGASAMIAGALGCIQGALGSAGRGLLTPQSARQLLRTTGAAQQDAPGRPATQRIGTRPDLRQVFFQLELARKNPRQDRTDRVDVRGLKQKNSTLRGSATPSTGRRTRLQR